MSNPLVSVRSLRTHFPHGRRAVVKAVDDVSFDIRRGEVMGLVGESGSGKSTVGLSILRLQKPTSGEILFDGVPLSHLSEREFRPWRRRMQYIFQDPYASLNPRKKVGATIAEGLAIQNIGSRRDRADRVQSLLAQVGLPDDAARLYPHEFSGGQRQRIGIARALAIEPDFIIADEPVSALDVSVQAQIVNLIQDLQHELGLTMLFIAHDLAVVEHLCDRVVVMYLGKVMEIGSRRDIYDRPSHPYTKALLSSVPRLTPRTAPRIGLEGDIPSPMAPPSGCVFRTRCPIATSECASVSPPMTAVSANGHKAACIHLEGSRGL